jgi:ligand-binding sensor domain-containing protein
MREVQGVTALYEDSGGNLWAGGPTGVWRWKPGPPHLYSIPDATHRIHALIEDDGGLLIAQNSGITRLKNGKAEAYPLPAGLEYKPRRLLRDRDRGLWIGASVDHGLLHNTRERRIDLHTPTGCRATPFHLSLRIAKAMFGSLPLMASTAFATSPSPRFLSRRVCPAGAFRPFSRRPMAPSGWARTMA